MSPWIIELNCFPRRVLRRNKPAGMSASGRASSVKTALPSGIGKLPSSQRRGPPYWNASPLDRRFWIPSYVGIAFAIFFFFKQKTAYEIGLGIPAEPLFRSFLDESPERKTSFIEISRGGKLPYKTGSPAISRSEERFSRNAETDLVCRLLLEKKKSHR